MRMFAQQWLHAGFATTQCVEANAVSPQIDFGADETMRPQGAYLEGVPQQARCSVFVGAAQIDDAALRRGGQV